MVIKDLILDYLKLIFYFPLWWYTKGFFKVLVGVKNSIFDYQNTLGFFIWVRNIFTPMFGQRDFSGRLVSFLMRLVNIIFRGFALLLIIIIHIGFVVLWLGFPIFVIWQIINL